MKNTISHDIDCLIYPGVFVPLMKEKEVQNELKKSYKSKTVLPAVNVTELSDSFKVEVSIPGVKREDFLIFADENILSVCAVHKDCGLHKGEKSQRHEFNHECFDRHIILPENADSDFISAEYAAGILYLHVPKTKQPAKNLHTRIAVY
jgi:HSP20 family protein